MTLHPLKVPFGTAKHSPIKNVRYLTWEDAFDGGLCILEPHATIRRANQIAPEAKFKSLQIEDWTHGGFFVHYDNPESFRGSFVVICA